MITQNMYGDLRSKSLQGQETLQEQGQGFRWRPSGQLARMVRTPARTSASSCRRSPDRATSLTVRSPEILYFLTFPLIPVLYVVGTGRATSLTVSSPEILT